MTKLYKLTDELGMTHHATRWGKNVTHSVDSSYTGTDLCSPDVIHAYEHPLIAVIMNVCHSDFHNPILWEAEGEIVAKEGQLKCGVKKLTTIRQIPLPVISADQRIKIAILCVRKIYKDEQFIKWSDDVLNGHLVEEPYFYTKTDICAYGMYTHTAAKYVVDATRCFNKLARYVYRYQCEYDCMLYVAATFRYIHKVNNYFDFNNIMENFIKS